MSPNLVITAHEAKTLLCVVLQVLLSFKTGACKMFTTGGMMLEVHDE
jgi:hypothetical protein